MKVLIVMSDAPTAGSIDLLLRSNGFATYVTDLGEEAVDLARIYTYDAILLADVLLDCRGLEVLRDLRAAKVMTPIVMLAHALGTDEEVQTFSAGADELIRMPFHRDVLVARLRAVIRRSQGHAAVVIEAGPLSIDIGSKQVLVDGKPVHLTGKEYAMVEALALRKGLVLSKEMLLNQLYGGMDEPEIKIIDVFACKVRNKLRPHGAEKHLETSWGRGYRLVDTPEEKPPMAAAPERRGPVQEAVLKALEGGEQPFEAIRRTIPWVSHTTVRGSISTLIDRGIVERYGSARATLYRLRAKAAA